jgi:hypothetical protein
MPPSQHLQPLGSWERPSRASWACSSLGASRLLVSRLHAAHLPCKFQPSTTHVRASRLPRTCVPAVDLCTIDEGFSALLVPALAVPLLARPLNALGAIAELLPLVAHLQVCMCWRHRHGLNCRCARKHVAHARTQLKRPQMRWTLLRSQIMHLRSGK